MQVSNLANLWTSSSATSRLMEPLMPFLENGWHQDLMVMARERLPKVLVMLLVLFALHRLVRFLVNRMSRVARTNGSPQRAAQLRTMGAILRATSYSILGFLAFLQILNLLNINYAPLLASAGIVGVGIGLGAQSLFKDIINGVFILIEDQYNVGETVRLAGLTGTVEDLTLRLTRLRDGDGTLYIIPNSQVATVSNLSRDYAVATLPVVVDASANPDHVIAVLTRLADSLQSDPAFEKTIIQKPDVLGVDKIDGRSIVYPINVRVLPNQKDGVLRELRKRIVLTFEQEQIPLGSAASMLILQNAKSDPTIAPTPNPLNGG